MSSQYKKYRRGIRVPLLVTVTVTIMLIVLSAHSVLATEIKFVKVGRFWTVVTDNGARPEADISAGWWPNDFNTVGNSTYSGTATGGNNIYLMCSDWEDPDGNVVPKVTCSAISTLNPSGTVIESIKSYVRYGFPGNIVTNQDGTFDVQQPALGGVDPTKMIGSSEQVVETTYGYAIGVQANVKAFAWSQQNHDDYVVIDITYTNAGDQTLNDFLIHMTPLHPGFQRANGSNPSPSSLGGGGWWCHYYGALPADSQRVHYIYHADNPTSAGDNMGQPAFDQEGRLIAIHAPFVGFLHASKEPFTNPADDVDDPLQPKVTFIAKGDLFGPSENNRDGISLSGYNDWYDVAYGKISDINPMPGAPEGTHHEVNNDEIGIVDYQSFSAYYTYAGFHGVYESIGPYATFEPGESVRLIYAVGTASLSLPTAKEVGKKMVEGTLEPPPDLPDPDKGYFPSNFDFPDGASQMDINKDLWLSTLVDSVHKMAHHARWNHDHGWNVPAAPPPPDFSIVGRADEAAITWSCPEVEALDNFAGYRILRRKSNLDMAFFEIIHTTPADDKAAEHTFSDKDVLFGASYYYYIQSAVRVPEDDPNALPSQRGKLLWSGRAYMATPRDIKPPRSGTETLSDIVIAPNPYNINDPNVVAQGWTDDRGILFFNLPAYCEINIYTVDGDRVKTITHDSPVLKVGSTHWDMITDNQQVISSGVYIATFKSREGEIAFRKFVVAR